MKKKILIILGIFTLLGFSFSYWYFNIYQKPIEQIPEQPAEKLEARKILEEWLNLVLRPEFLPPELDIELGVDTSGGVTRDKNTWGYSWHYLGKDFYTALDYNNKRPGINAYILLVVLWEEKIDLDQEIATKLLENYFHLPKPNLKCETKRTEREIVNFCRGSWIDEKENWHSVSVASGYLGEMVHTFLKYHLTPLESETYGEELFGQKVKSIGKYDKY